MDLNGLRSETLNQNKRGCDSDFSRLITNERILKFDTAKSFWNECKDILGCTYNRYAVVERGTAKPSLDLAIRITAALEIDESIALYAWVRDLMPDNQRKSHFIDFHSAKNIASYKSAPINPDQAKLFKENPISNEIASYISAYSWRGVSETELIKVFLMSKKEVQSIVKKLLFTETIELNRENLFIVPEEAWINIPDLSEYREARIRNFVLSIDSHFSSDYIEDLTIEQATFRVLSKKQISIVRKLARGLARMITLLPDDHENGMAYRFFCGGNVCKFGNDRKNIAPKERKIVEY